MKRQITLALIAVFAVIGVLSVPLTQSAQAESLVPEWIKTNAGWWADGTLDDETFLNGITYLLENNIINVSSESNTVDVDTLTIGFIPVEKADELTPKAQALETFLESELGVDVEIVVPTNYETIIEGMRFGHIDAAFMDTGPAWITHQRTGAEAVMAELVKGKVNYQATVWTLAENDSINSLEDTVGKKVAFTSITGSNFESYTFAGGYKAALTLLLEEKVDVAFGSDIAPQKYLELEDQVKLRPVTTIGPVPSHVFMVNSDMSDSTKNALVDALVELNYDENNHILTK
jgi:phosphonate transport system substrate-binding protein